MEALGAQRREYTRHRDARVALIRCGECREYYETSVRQARRIRNGENRRLCPMCRNLLDAHEAEPDRTEEYVRWWAEESGLAPGELVMIASMIYPEEARASESTVTPNRRLSLAEGTSTTASPAAGVHLAGVGQPVNCSNAA